jgi:predicted RNase H-like HicB family nuclease
MARRAVTFDPTSEYTIEARRSGGWWALTVPGLPGVHSQARRLEQAEAMITDAIALAFDVDPAAVKLYGPIPVVNPELDELLQSTQERRRQLAQLRVDVDALSRKLAHDMASQGIPVRDIATALDVSFQHAAKLAKQTS